MTFELIDDRDAPENLSAMSDDAKEKLALIRALKPGKTAKVAVEKTKQQGYKAALTRLAGKQKPEVNLEVWGDEMHVFARLAKPKE